MYVNEQSLGSFFITLNLTDGKIYIEGLGKYSDVSVLNYNILQVTMGHTTLTIIIIHSILLVMGMCSIKSISDISTILITCSTSHKKAQAQSII